MKQKYIESKENYQYALNSRRELVRMYAACSNDLEKLKRNAEMIEILDKKVIPELKKEMNTAETEYHLSAEYRKDLKNWILKVLPIGLSLQIIFLSYIAVLMGSYLLSIIGVICAIISYFVTKNYLYRKRVMV